MFRLAIGVIAAAIVVALIALLMRGAMRMIGAETGHAEKSLGGPMPKIAFFLLLCVMAYAISTGAS